MCDLALYNDTNSGSTSISNCFIDEYLADANDAQIKVYLYLIRMTNSGRATNISDMADKFNHTEKDICRALRYWEKKGLLSLDYDNNGGIVGVRLFEPTVPARHVMNTSAGSSFTPVIMPSVNTRTTTGASAPVINAVTNFNTGMTGSTMPVQTAPERSFKKPEISTEELRSFKKREDSSQLVFIAEQYLKKTLSANDIRSIIFYVDVLGFSEDLFDTLIQYCVRKEKTNFTYIDKVAITWAENNITTPKEAKAFINKIEKKPGTKTGSAKNNLSFHQMEQNNYDFASIEMKLLSQD